MANDKEMKTPHQVPGDLKWLLSLKATWGFPLSSCILCPVRGIPLDAPRQARSLHLSLDETKEDVPFGKINKTSF